MLDLLVHFLWYYLRCESDVILLDAHAPVHTRVHQPYAHQQSFLLSAVSTACVLMLGIMNYGEGTCAAGFTSINKTSACSSLKEKGAGKAGLGLIESAISLCLPFPLSRIPLSSSLQSSRAPCILSCVLSSVFGSCSPFHALAPTSNSLSDVTPLRLFQAEAHSAAPLSLNIFRLSSSCASFPFSFILSSCHLFPWLPGFQSCLCCLCHSRFTGFIGHWEVAFFELLSNAWQHSTYMWKQTSPGGEDKYLKN